METWTLQMPSGHNPASLTAAPWFCFGMFGFSLPCSVPLPANETMLKSLVDSIRSWCRWGVPNCSFCTNISMESSGRAEAIWVFPRSEIFFWNLVEINWSFQPHEYGKSFLWTWPTCAYSQTGLNYVKTRFLLKFLLNGWVYVKRGPPQTLNAIKESIMHPAVTQHSFKMNCRPRKVAHFNFSVLYRVNQITNIFPAFKTAA